MKRAAERSEVKKCPVDTFLARGKVHVFLNASVRMWAEIHKSIRSSAIEHRKDVLFFGAPRDLKRAAERSEVKKCPVDTFLVRGRIH